MSYQYGRYSRTKRPELYPAVENKPLTIDWELLKDLLRFRTPSRSKAQAEFSKAIADKIKKQIPGVTVWRDKLGNVYADKGTAELKPCIIAHMDINQDAGISMEVMDVGGWMFGIDLDTGTQVGAGFDDKCGVYACLHMLGALDNVKVALFVDEEVGCAGSGAADPTFFYDCTMILQLDRNGYNGAEFIWHTNGVEVCGADFMAAAEYLFDKYAYEAASGVYTDVGTIKQLNGVDVIGANIGCGYFDEHTDSEVLNMRAFENAVNFAYELMVDLGGIKWEHTTPRYEPPATKGWRGKYYGGSGSSADTTDWGRDTAGLDTEAYAWEKDYEKDANGVYHYKGNKWNPEDDPHYYNAKKKGTTNEDDEAIKELEKLSEDGLLDMGICPKCEAEDKIVEDIDGMMYCNCCSSYFRVPQGINWDEGDMPF